MGTILLMDSPGIHAPCWRELLRRAPRAMGCASSSRIQPHPSQVAKDRKATAEFERQLAKARAAQAANTNAALSFGQQFELTTPMLVMPFL